MNVAKGRRSHPTRLRTLVSGVPNRGSDRNAKEPGSWDGSQSTPTTLVMVTPSHCLPLREAQPCASHTQVSLTHPSPSGGAPMRFTHSGVSHASPTILLPSRVPHTYWCFTYHWVLHTGVNLTLGVPRMAHTVGGPPMTSRQAIPLLTPFVAKGRRSHPTRLRTQVSRVPNRGSDRNAKEPGSLGWQSEHTHNSSDGHSITHPQSPYL